MRRPVLVLLLVAGLFASPAASRAEDETPDLDTPAGIKKALGDADPSVRLAAARAAADVQDRMLTSPLLKLLKDDRVPLQEAALEALVGRTDEKERKAAAKGIAALLKPLEREPDTADVAREQLLVPALHDLAQEVAMKRLLDFHAEAPRELTGPRLLAVGNIPSRKAIEALINVASKQRRGRGRAAGVQAALRYATGMNLGADPDAWRAWWREAEKDFDVEEAARRRQAARDEKAAQADRKEERRRKQEEKRRDREEKRRGRQRPDDEDGGA